MINFDKIDITELPEFNGGTGTVKGRIFQNEHMKIMKAELEKGCSIGFHTHLTSCEVVYVISGRAKCRIADQTEYVKEGECHYCPKGVSHSIANENDEPLIMLCVVPNQ